MPPDDRGPSGKRPARVAVYVFPKKAKGPGPSSTAPRRPTQTQPLPSEGWDENDLVTEPYFIPEGASKPRVTPPWPRTPTPSAVPRRGREKKRRSPAKRRSKGALPSVTGAPKAARESVAERSVYGHRLFEEGKVEEARRVFEKLVALDVADPFPHSMLGTIYLALGEPERALALFQACLAIDPNDLAALTYRGEIRLNRGKLKPALGDLNRAVELGAADDPFVLRARRLLRLAHDLARPTQK